MLLRGRGVGRVPRRPRESQSRGGVGPRCSLSVRSSPWLCSKGYLLLSSFWLIYKRNAQHLFSSKLQRRLGAVSPSLSLWPPLPSHRLSPHHLTHHRRPQMPQGEMVNLRHTLRAPLAPCASNCAYECCPLSGVHFDDVDRCRDGLRLYAVRWRSTRWRRRRLN